MQLYIIFFTINNIFESILFFTFFFPNNRFQKIVYLKSNKRFNTEYKIIIFYIINRIKKNYILSKLPFVIITLVIIYIIYFLITMPKHSETYIYYVKSLHKNSKINVLDNDTNVYTNHIYADLYNTQNTKVGLVFSVNNHRIINNINHVTTLSTYITPNGTFTCRYYYKTTLNDHYFYGSINIW